MARGGLISGLISGAVKAGSGLMAGRLQGQQALAEQQRTEQQQRRQDAMDLLRVSLDQSLVRDRTADNQRAEAEAQARAARDERDHTERAREFNVREQREDRRVGLMADRLARAGNGRGHASTTAGGADSDDAAAAEQKAHEMFATNSTPASIAAYLALEWPGLGITVRNRIVNNATRGYRQPSAPPPAPPKAGGFFRGVAPPTRP